MDLSISIVHFWYNFVNKDQLGGMLASIFFPSYLVKEKNTPQEVPKITAAGSLEVRSLSLSQTPGSGDILLLITDPRDPIGAEGSRIEIPMLWVLVYCECPSVPINLMNGYQQIMVCKRYRRYRVYLLGLETSPWMPARSK